ncbi:MAG TPA: hypothetical protein PKD53_31390 [Chloroflexaceae bacterium]|nr:hypothetical protein [Chloroflexaceae bacterium]
MQRSQPDRAAGRPLAALNLALAWLLVGAPLAWGVYETVMKSLLLFR